MKLRTKFCDKGVLPFILIAASFSIAAQQEANIQIFDYVSDELSRGQMLTTELKIQKPASTQVPGNVSNADNALDQNNPVVKQLMSSGWVGKISFGTLERKEWSMMDLLDGNQQTFLSFSGPLAGAQISQMEFDNDVGDFEGLTANIELDGEIGDLALVLNDDQVSGLITHEGQTYEIKHLYDSWHAFLEVDVKNNLRSSRTFDDDVFLEEGILDSAVQQASLDDTSQDKTTGDCRALQKPREKSVIEVVFGYTDAALKKSREEVTDLKTQIEGATLISNRGLSKSGVNAKFKIKGIFPVDYEEASDPGYFKTDMQNLKQSYNGLAFLHKKRKELKADIAVLIANNENPGRCGIAAGIDVSQEDGLAIVNWRCMTNKLSYAHEVGHLVGARHDNDPNQPEHAHGFFAKELNPPVSFCTVMATQRSCLTAKGGRIWNWSNPYINHNGLPTGTVEKNNNACIWNANVNKIASFNGG